MKGRPFTWLEEMPYNKIPRCSWCPAAVRENKAVLGARREITNQTKEDKHNLKRTAFPATSEKVALP